MGSAKCQKLIHTTIYYNQLNEFERTCRNGLPIKEIVKQYRTCSNGFKALICE